jgi:hypothetical protein
MNFVNNILTEIVSSIKEFQLGFTTKSDERHGRAQDQILSKPHPSILPIARNSSTLQRTNAPLCGFSGSLMASVDTGGSQL